jgi:hypothetical protein
VPGMALADGVQKDLVPLGGLDGIEVDKIYHCIEDVYCAHSGDFDSSLDWIAPLDSPMLL